MTVFYGPNEAGKSTTVAFIKQILFGYYLRSQSSTFFEDYRPLKNAGQLAGSLTFLAANGDHYRLERVWSKGENSKRGSLKVWRNQEEVPAATFFDQLKNIDAGFYTDSFIFNQDTLGQINSLSQKDLLERIYYLGAAQSGQILALRDDFAAQAEQLFKKNGRKPEINRLLAELADKRADLDQAQKEYQEYQSLAQSLQQEQKQFDRQLAKQQQLEAEIKAKQDLLNKSQISKRLAALKKQQHAVAYQQELDQKLQQQSQALKTGQAELTQLQKQQEHEPVDLQPVQEQLALEPQVLQSQSQQQTLNQQLQTAQAAQAQLLQLNPGLRQLQSLKPQQLEQLKQTYQNLPPTQNSSIFVWASLAGLLATLLLLAFKPQFSWLPLLVTLLFAGLAYWQKRKQQEYDRFKEQYGLDPTHDLSGLFTAWSQYQYQTQTCQQLQQQLAAIAAKQKHWQQQLNSDDLTTSFRKLRQKLTALQQAKLEQTQLTNQIERLQGRLQTLRLQQMQLLNQLGVKDAAEYHDRYQDFLKQTQLREQVAALESELGPKPEQVDFDQLQQELEKQEAAYRNLTAGLEDQRQSLAQRRLELTNLANSDAVLTAKQTLANSQSRLAQASQEYLADLLASDWLGQFLNLASNQRFPKMLAKAQKYLTILTAGHYQGLTFKPKLAVTTALGNKLAVKYLSRATAEQLYFALKLAFVTTIADQIQLPILIDDSFVNFDDQRTAEIKNLLQEISKDSQVLIFTARKDLAAKLGQAVLNFRKTEIQDA